ncbi:MAG: putative cytosol aminopeptidase [Chloroflexota bacterium]|nr:MAG: putative cytosol aminopeptidase [Chloroflexota bacterium]
MELRVVVEEPWTVGADALVVPILGEPAFEGALAELDRRSGGELSNLAAFGELSGKRYATALAAPGELPVKRVVAVGAGPAAEVDRETVRCLAAAGLRRLAGRRVDRLAVWCGPLVGALGGDAATVAELVTRGIVEGGYDPKRLYRDDVESAPPRLAELVLVVPDGDAAALAAAAERGRIVGEGANLARDLANRSAAELPPEGLAEEARSIAARYGLAVDVIDEGRAAELGMNLFLAVGRGSDNPPRLIVLRSGAPEARDAQGRLLALLGKGVCFDSGGISIKPADRMEEMKMDKAGAATVIAAAATLARLAPGLPFLVLAPAVENMPGPHSTRPGDVVRALNGKWVDITNTDAEGRLILGDALTYAERLGATHLVDVATLTGAVGRMLGHLVTGGFGTPQAWYDAVAAAARRAGERLWQIPLVDDYRADMDSWYGDFTNAGAPEGGLVKSGLFLKEFVTVPWVHLDIGGTAYFRKATPYAPRGATGVTHATLVELALEGAPARADRSA